MANKRPQGFTLIEMITSLVIIGILAVAAYTFIAPVIKLFFFAPTQLNTQFLGTRLVQFVIKGDDTYKGLRLVKSVTAANATAISYIDTNDNPITINWNNADKSMSRTTPAGTAIIPPGMGSPVIKIDGQTAGKIFIYLTSDGVEIPSPIADPSQIGRIILKWVVYTGSGSMDNLQGKHLINTGVRIKQFN